MSFEQRLGPDRRQLQSFHRWRRVLLRDIEELCGDVKPGPLAQVEAMPERHP